MFYGNHVQDTRQLFFTCWQKYKKKLPLLPLETQIINVIIDHPEYHTLLDNQSSNLNKSYLPEMGETNPFLHMGLHMAVREQIATDRPQGIKNIYQLLINKGNEPINVEHLMMERLAECLWAAQKDNRIPDESSYLNQLKKLCRPI
ncbi:DUF1841 family protein [Legionella israelensis]|uniref:DUF1841 family protein n=1 Tax=Legionella israelensis TaxID=454 RepID=A0AAX1EE70_9GAMM|nr:DUF1841 family protein [Legionella israelensis]QBR83157.1 DUF1841 family protein [Legionella israelensis]